MKRTMLIVATSLALAACGDAETKKGDSETPSMSPTVDNPIFNSEQGGFQPTPGGTTVSTSIPSSAVYSDLSGEEREQLCADVTSSLSETATRTQFCSVLGVVFSEGDSARCQSFQSECVGGDLDVCEDLETTCDATVGQFVACYQARLDILMGVDAPSCDAITQEDVRRAGEALDSAEDPTACAPISDC